MPLAGYGIYFAWADDCGLDWRLLPAIAVQESTGGKFIPQGSWNPFGWGSGRIYFPSFEDAIYIVASHLCGLRVSTAHYYAGKDTMGILRTYNPPTIAPNYVVQVINIMGQIEDLTKP
jgi:hypothetical protein